MFFKSQMTGTNKQKLFYSQRLIREISSNQAFDTQLIMTLLNILMTIQLLHCDIFALALKIMKICERICLPNFNGIAESPELKLFSAITELKRGFTVVVSLRILKNI